MENISNGKAPGVDGIPTELLKHGGSYLKKELNTLIYNMRPEKKTSADLKAANIVKINRREGDKSACGNYRGLSSRNRWRTTIKNRE